MQGLKNESLAYLRVGSIRNNLLFDYVFSAKCENLA